MRRRGMTLLELLVALSIATVMLVAVAGAFQAATATRTRLRERVPRLANLRSALQILQRDLRCLTYAPEELEYPVMIEPGPLASRYPQQVLIFASGAVDPLLAGRPAAGVALIQYELGPEPGSDRPGLWRHETPFPLTLRDGTSATDMRSALLLPGVVSLQVRFYDAEQGAWVDTWEVTDRLPASVWVDIGVAEAEDSPEGAETVRIHSVIATVNVAGWQPEVHETPNAPGGTAPGGTAP